MILKQEKNLEVGQHVKLLVKGTKDRTSVYYKLLMSVKSNNKQVSKNK